MFTSHFQIYYTIETINLHVMSHFQIYYTIETMKLHVYFSFQINYTIERINLHVNFPFSNLLYHRNNKSGALLLIFIFITSYKQWNCMFTSLFQIYYTIETINLHVYFSFSNLLHHRNNETSCLLLICKFITLKKQWTCMFTSHF